jgi:hypothetical protein
VLGPERGEKMKLSEAIRKKKEERIQIAIEDYDKEMSWLDLIGDIEIGDPIHVHGGWYSFYLRYETVEALMQAFNTVPFRGGKKHVDKDETSIRFSLGDHKALELFTWARVCELVEEPIPADQIQTRRMVCHASPAAILEKEAASR